MTSDIQAGEYYSFKVSAVNVVGESQLTDSFTIIAATVPDRISPAPHKHLASTSSIEIRWQEPNNGGSLLISYEVQWDEGRGNGQFYYLGTTTYQTFTVDASLSSQFIGGDSYLFRVKAKNAVGDGSYSDDSLTIISAEVPSVPSDLTLVSHTETKLVLSWTQAEDGGSTIREYQIYSDRGIQSYSMLTPTIDNPSVHTYTITQATHGIVTGTQYAFKVLARNDVGNSEFSTELVQVMPAVLPTKPLSLVLISSTSSTIHFSWSEPSYNGGTPISDYQIYWDQGTDQFVLLEETTLGMNSFFH